MRRQHQWCEEVAGLLKGEVDDPRLLCQVELGLRLLERLDPEQPAVAVWTLLGGYPFARARGLARDIDAEWMIACTRHRLWTLRRRRTWIQALLTYATFPERLRAYRITDDLGHVTRIKPTIASNRLDDYDNALTSLPEFARSSLESAGPGSHRFLDRRRVTSVIIPDSLAVEGTVPGHELVTPTKTNGTPVDISLDDFVDVARWMDSVEQEQGLPPNNWEDRLPGLRLRRRTEDGTDFERHGELRLNGLTHLVGMVGAGKSTLMTLIAVWAAQRGMRTTLVVGDVAEQLRLTTLFRDLLGPDAAAPVLGSTTRETHVQRLHRRLAAKGALSIFDHYDEPAFHDLSTACPLDALRATEADLPLRFADAPCRSLHATPTRVRRGEPDGDSVVLPVAYRDRHRHVPVEHDDEDLGPALGCPLWHRCPRHRAAHQLVDALIWVANPASLVQSQVPDQLNVERLRHLELACLRSDIVIVDEVDRVMMNLDTMFAPSATLVTKGPESWLDQLHTHKIGELAREGRLQLSEPDVARWEASLTAVSAATNRLYQMLISDAELRRWVDIDNFSSWTLQGKLLADWYPTAEALGRDATPGEHEVYDPDEDADIDEPPRDTPGETPWDKRRAEVTRVLDRFRDDPLGDHGPYGPDIDRLIAAAHDLLNSLNPRGTRDRVRAVLDGLLTGSPAISGDLPTPRPRKGETAPQPAEVHGSQPWYERTAKRLEFHLLLAVLHQRLNRLTYLWPQVEASLRLDTTDNELVRRPPIEYAPMIPESPMGNVLGFQYLPDERQAGVDPDGRVTGTLRFFRCAGVGRELLLSLSDIGRDHAGGRSGPHVLLMSGTSWAGTSTRAHVLAPVDAVLEPDDESLAAVRETVFTTRFLYDRHNNPISLSGLDPSVRPARLREMIDRLGKRPQNGAPSPLEQELGQIRDPDRLRALVLVGSYKEAAAAADQLNEMQRWNGRVRLLVADDAELDYALRGATTETAPLATAVRRGDVASFATDPDAEVLIAPLLAVERGHNILNNKRKAAFGTVLFLARPHPRPDDLSLAVFAINDWVTRFTRNLPTADPAAGFDRLVVGASSLDQSGTAFRSIARAEWGRLLARRYSYSALSPQEKQSFAWDQLVTIWQVIGRLVRGGVAARVVFLDAKFAPHTAANAAPGKTRPSRRRDTAASSLLVNLREVLAPYFADSADGVADPGDPALVRMLYRPLYEALRDMEEIR